MSSGRTSSASTWNGNCAEVGAWRKAERSMANGNCAEVGAWRKSAASINDAGAGSECAEVGAWRVPLASDGGACAGSECAEVGAWRVPLASDAGACAEVGTGAAVVGVRDTKQAHLGETRTVLEFSSGAWGRFLAQLRQEA